MPMDDLEAGLATALRASLVFDAKTRPAYIALRLLHEMMADTYDVVMPPPPKVQVAPKDIDATIAELTRVVKEAVNSGVRQATADEVRCSIVEGIADHLLLLNGGGGLFGDGQVEPEEIAATNGAQADASEAAPALSEVDKNVVAAALAGRGGPRKVSYARYVLGRSATAVMPAVIGAFQEQAAKRAAREVDDKLINESVEAGKRVARLAAERQQREDEQGLAHLDGLPKGAIAGR